MKNATLKMLLNIQLSKRLILSGLIFICAEAKSQQRTNDELRKILSTEKNDTTRIKPLLELGQHYIMVKPDTSMHLFTQTLRLSRQYHLKNYEAESLLSIGGTYSVFPGKRDSAELYMEQGLSLARANQLYNEEVMYYLISSTIYLYIWNNPDSAILLARQGMEIANKHKLVNRQVDLTYPLMSAYLQQHKPDSSLDVLLTGLTSAKKNNRPDIEKSFFDLANNIISKAPADTVKLLANMLIDWAQKTKDKKYEAQAWKIIGIKNQLIGNYPEAIRAFKSSLEVYQDLQDLPAQVEVLNKMGHMYREQSEYRLSLSSILTAAEIQEKIQDSMVMYAYTEIGIDYSRLFMGDSARFYADKAYRKAASEYTGDIPGGVLDDIGEIYFEMGEDSLAMNYFRKALNKIPDDGSDEVNLGEINHGIAMVYKKWGQIDSSFFYASRALPYTQRENQMNYIINASTIISDYYKARHRIDSAFHYQEIAIRAKDSLFNYERVKEIQKIEFNEQMQRQQVVEAENKYRNRTRTFLLLAGLGILVLVATILLRNNRNKQRAYRLLQKQKQETDKQKIKAEETLGELKTAQVQLIQSEKMASLGELTAGIAHEIQNPLNFVNNFAGLNMELAAELKTELAAGNHRAANDLAENIIENSEKIHNHGGRADSIVKSMLQHSRGSIGKKEPTDINVLADECLRLTFHGMRAKDNSFNANMETHFDNTLPKYSLVPQDIGRVFLNFFTNAFFSVAQKKKQADNSFVPAVSVSTASVPGGVSIEIRDNGQGIAAKNMARIYEPFFTTKPTGQGTGLGLSLSFDIISKGHGGTIKVDSKEGEYASFTIFLPHIT